MEGSTMYNCMPRAATLSTYKTCPKGVGSIDSLAFAPVLCYLSLIEGMVAFSLAAR